MYTRKIYEPENELRIQIPGHGIGRAAGSSAQQETWARPTQTRLVSNGSGGTKNAATVGETKTEPTRKQSGTRPGSIVELKDPYKVSTQHEVLDDMIYEVIRPLDRAELEQRVSDTKKRRDDLEEARRELNVITDPTVWDVILNPFGKSSAAQSKELEHRAKWLDTQIAETERDLAIYNGRLDNMIMAEDMAEFATWSKEEQDAARAHIQWRADTFFSGGSPADRYETEESKRARDISGLYGRYSEERLTEILESVERDQNARTLAEYQTSFDEAAEKGGYWNFLPSVAATFWSASANIPSILYSNMQNTGRYSTSDPNHLGQALSMYSQTVTEHNAQNFGKDMLSFLEYAGTAGYAGVTGQGAPTTFQPRLYEGLEGTKAQKVIDTGGALLYIGGKTAADDLLRKGVGALAGGPAGKAVTLGLAGVGSFGDTYNAATRKGASPSEAAMLAVADAGVEVLTECIPLDDWWATVKANKTLATGLALDIFAQCGIEIATEELNLIISASTEYAALGSRSEYGRLMTELMEQEGYTREQAERAAFRAFMEDALETAAVTGISTGLEIGGARAVTGLRGNTDTQTQRSGGTAATASGLPTYQDMNAALADIGKRQGQTQVTQTQGTVPSDTQDSRGHGEGGRPEMVVRDVSGTDDAAVPYLTSDHWTGELEGLWTDTEVRTATDTAIDMDSVYGTDIRTETDTKAVEQQPMRYEDALKTYLHGDTRFSAKPDVQTGSPDAAPNADLAAVPDLTQETAPKPKEQIISELAPKIRTTNMTSGRAMIAAEQTYTDAVKRFGANASAVLDQIEPGQDPTRFLDGFQNAYLSGTMGSGEALKDSSAAAYLSEEQRQTAYKLGESNARTVGGVPPSGNTARTSPARDTVRNNGDLPSVLKNGTIEERKAAFKKAFDEGLISTRISPQKQARHIWGTKAFLNYDATMAQSGDHPSYLREDLSERDLRELVTNRLQGVVRIVGNHYYEYVCCDEVIGYYYNKHDGRYVPTMCAQVAYALGDKNIHIIPVKEK